MAISGLGRELWIATRLAIADESIGDGTKQRLEVIEKAMKSWKKLQDKKLRKQELATEIYKPLVKDSRASKATTAQYLADLLEEKTKNGELDSTSLRKSLPEYLVKAIDYVTSSENELVEEGSDECITP